MSFCVLFLFHLRPARYSHHCTAAIAECGEGKGGALEKQFGSPYFSPYFSPFLCGHPFLKGKVCVRRWMQCRGVRDAGTGDEQPLSAAGAAAAAAAAELRVACQSCDV